MSHWHTYTSNELFVLNIMLSNTPTCHVKVFTGENTEGSTGETSSKRQAWSGWVRWWPAVFCSLFLVFLQFCCYFCWQTFVQTCWCFLSTLGACCTRQWEVNSINKKYLVYSFKFERTKIRKISPLYFQTV